MGFDDLSWLENYTLTPTENTQTGRRGVGSSINTNTPSTGMPRGGGMSTGGGGGY